MFSNLNFPSLKTVLLGGAVIGGLATVGYITYKYIMNEEEENIRLDGNFGDFDVSATAERARRVAKLARGKAIVDPKAACCIIKKNQCTRGQINEDKEAEIIHQTNGKMRGNGQTETPHKNLQEENGQTQLTEKRAEKQIEISENHEKRTQEESCTLNGSETLEDSKSQTVQQTPSDEEDEDEEQQHEKVEIDDDKRKEVNEQLQKEAKKENEDEGAEVEEDREKVKEDEVPNKNDVPHPLGTEAAASTSSSTHQSGPMPGIFIPDVLKNVKTMKDFEQTMEALCVFLFKVDRTQEELDEAKRELGWVYNLAKGFLHRLPDNLPDFNEFVNDIQ